MSCDPLLMDRLIRLGRALVDQERAQILVEPQRRSSGFWFGGGNVIQDVDGSLLLCGRYRNEGDSRTGVAAGERGLELAIFRAAGMGGPFEKIRAFSKAELNCDGKEVVSIEGAALLRTEQGIELFVSTEKAVPYPERLADFQKPGTGVWSIDRMVAPAIEKLNSGTIHEVVPSGPPERLHSKDPVPTVLADGSVALIYCTHPYSWSSSGSAVRIRRPGARDFVLEDEDMLRRGPVWDIAAARITDRMQVPRAGVFSDAPATSLYFYDSCESLRAMDENARAVKRPRGYSCEELGGLAFGNDEAFPGGIESITVEAPLFVSPHGTGCSRYVSTLVLPEGILATWQQSQNDRSQPLVGHFLPMERVEALLAR